MTDRPDPVRRNLLAGVPLASASLALSTTEAQADVPAPAKADPRQPRFETTDHIATFYRLNRR